MREIQRAIFSAIALLLIVLPLSPQPIYNRCTTSGEVASECRCLEGEERAEKQDKGEKCNYGKRLKRARRKAQKS
ncbi:MAG: hypothetical protein SNH01_02900 [Rikenellaceae bacterium]